MNARDGAVAVGRPHLRRLREVWRSAGWPWQDMIEVELLAAGLLERRLDGAGRETVRVTDAGVQAIAADVQAHRAARGAHEALVERVVLEMQRAGRIVWRGLRLRAALQTDPAEAASVAASGADLVGGAVHASARVRWVLAMPDVFSIRRSTREDALEPIVHEIKVSRADLLADLKRPDKARAYSALAGECWYVVSAGLCDAREIPEAYGLIQAHDHGRLEIERPAPRRGARLGLATWMALAKAAPHPDPDRDDQTELAPASH